MTVDSRERRAAEQTPDAEMQAMRVATQPEAGGSVSWGDLVAQRARAFAERIVRPLSWTGITPNALTILGFLLTGLVAVVIGSGREQIGGVLVILVGLFDMLDGALARVNGQKTRFGAFLDSTLDRYSEAVILAGVLYVYYPDLQVMLLVIAVLTGSLMVSYTRARAEGIDLDCEVGWLPRPQRVVLLAAGLITGLVVPALWILAVLTHVTTVQRILHVYRALHGR